MKAGLCVAVLLLIGAIAVLVWTNAQHKQQAQQQVAAAQLQVQAVEAELEQSRSREKQAASAPPPVVTRPKQAQAGEAIPTAAHVAKSSPSPLLKDPETRELMRKQQDQSLAKHAERLINDEFARAWKLTSEQTAQARTFFRDRAGAAKDMLNAMMFDGLDDEALSQRGRETKQRINSAEQGLREVLGNEGFAALTEQERASEDRDRMRRVRGELANSAEPMTKEQQEALYSAYVAERQAFSFRVNLGDPSNVDFEHMRDYFTAANIQKYFEDMQQLNARVAERAALFLSPAQLDQLKVAENTHLERSRLTAKMTTELFNRPKN